MIMLIIYIGLFFDFMLTLLTVLVVNGANKKLHFQKKRLGLYIVISFIFSLILLYTFIFFQLNVTYPVLFGEKSVIEKFGLLYLYFTYYAIFFLSSPVYLWFIFMFINFIMLKIILKAVLRQKVEREYHEPFEYKKNEKSENERFKRKKKKGDFKIKMP